MERLLEHLAARRTLLVLDNCEHVIDGVAALVEALLAGTAQHDASWRPAAKAWASAANRSIRCARCRCRRPRICTRCKVPSRCASSSIARGSRCPTSRSTPTTPRRSRRSAGAWTALRWRSNWRRRACRCCRWPRSPRGWTTASACSPAAAAHCRATRRCKRRCSGATSSWRRRSSACCARCRSSPAAGRCRRRPTSRRPPTSTKRWRC